MVKYGSTLEEEYEKLMLVRFFMCVHLFVFVSFHFISFCFVLLRVASLYTAQQNTTHEYFSKLILTFKLVFYRCYMRSSQLLFTAT